MLAALMRRWPPCLAFSQFPRVKWLLKNMSTFTERSVKIQQESDRSKVGWETGAEWQQSMVMSTWRHLQRLQSKAVGPIDSLTSFISLLISSLQKIVLFKVVNSWPQVCCSLSYSFSAAHSPPILLFFSCSSSFLPSYSSFFTLIASLQTSCCSRRKRNARWDFIKCVQADLLVGVSVALVHLIMRKLWFDLLYLVLPFSAFMHTTNVWQGPHWHFLPPPEWKSIKRL